MNVISYRPWSLMNRLHGNLDSPFRGPIESDETRSTTDWIPAVDITEEPGRFVLRADVPGVEPEAIDITMQDGVLTLRGERRDEQRDEADGFRRIERIKGQFHRRFALPDTADPQNIQARSRNGVLEVLIPKLAAVQPRRIQVSAD